MVAIRARVIAVFLIGAELLLQRRVAQQIFPELTIQTARGGCREVTFRRRCRRAPKTKKTRRNRGCSFFECCDCYCGGAVGGAVIFGLVVGLVVACLALLCLVFVFALVADLLVPVTGPTVV